LVERHHFVIAWYAAAAADQ